MYNQGNDPNGPFRLKRYPRARKALKSELEERSLPRLRARIRVSSPNSSSSYRSKGDALPGCHRVLAALALSAPAFAADPRRDEQWGLEMVKAPERMADLHRRRRRRRRHRHRRPARPPRPRRPPAAGLRLRRRRPDEPATRTTTRPTATATARTSPGIIAANRDNGEGIAGVAPGARVLPIRVLDDDGEGYADDTIKAIDHAIDQRRRRDQPEPRRLRPAPVDAVRRPGLRGRARARRRGGDRRGHRGRQQQPAEVREPGGRRDRLRRRGRHARRPQRLLELRLERRPDGARRLGPRAAAPRTSSPPTSTAATSRSPGTSQATPHVAGRRGAARVARPERAGGGEPRSSRPPTPATGPTFMYGAGIVDAAAAVAGLGAPPPDGPRRPGSGHGQLLDARARGEAARGAPARLPRDLRGRAARHLRRRASGASGRKIARGSDDVPADDRHRRSSAALNRRGQEGAQAAWASASACASRSPCRARWRGRAASRSSARLAERRFQAVSTAWRNRRAKSSTAG